MRVAGPATSGALTLLAGVLGAVVNLVVGVAVGRVLGPEGAGAYFAVVAAATIAAGTAELGVDTGLVRLVAAARAVDRPQDVAVLVRAALPPVVVATTFVGVGGSALALVVEVPWWALTAVALAAGMLAVTAVLLGVTRGLADAVTYPVLQHVLLPVARAGAVLAAIALGGGSAAVLVAWAVPAPLVLGLAALVVVRHLSAARHAAAGRPGDPCRGGELWRFSVPRGLAAAVEVALEWVDVLVVGALAGAAAAGVYAVVTRCVRASEVVQQTVRLVVSPAVSSAFARGDPVAVGRLHRITAAATTWVAWPFLAHLAVFGDVVLSWFGPGFVAGYPALVVLCVALAVQARAGAVQTVLLMAGRSRWQLLDKTGALGLLVVLDLALVPVLGVTGAAIGWAVVLVVDTAVVTAQVRRLVGVTVGPGPARTAAVASVLVVALPALVARQVLGASSAVLAGSVVLLGAAHLGCGWALRHRLGLSDRDARPPARRRGRAPGPTRPSREPGDRERRARPAGPPG